MKKPTIGILGAGKVGIVLAQLGLKAGYEVSISGSGNASKIALTVAVLAPGARAGTPQEVAQMSDLLILALPLGKYKTIPKAHMKGKLLIDAMNYWWEVDGIRPDLSNPAVSSSELVQSYLDESRIVKAFSHMGYHDLHDGVMLPGSPHRKAIAIAGDNRSDTDIVASIVDDFGFDPVYIGALRNGRQLQPGGIVFGKNIETKALKNLIET